MIKRNRILPRATCTWNVKKKPYVHRKSRIKHQIDLFWLPRFTTLFLSLKIFSFLSMWSHCHLVSNNLNYFNTRYSHEALTHVKLKAICLNAIEYYLKDIASSIFFFSNQDHRKSIRNRSGCITRKTLHLSFFLFGFQIFYAVCLFVVFFIELSTLI